MNKVYLVTFTPGEKFNAVTLHDHIKNIHTNGTISDWWHYLDYAYLVVSSKQVNELYNAIYPGIPGQHLLIIEVNIKNSQGWLLTDAWTWIQKYRAL